MFTPNLNLVLLFVENPAVSRKFYEELLGLQAIESSPTFVMFKLPNEMLLGLWSKYTAEPPPAHSSGAQELCFHVEDVDQTYDAIAGLSIVVLQKPTDMDFGRTFVIKDPDGHRIRIYKFLEEAS